MKKALGIDIGGTKIQAAVIDEKGRMLEHVQIPTFAHLGTNEIIKRVCGLIDQLLIDCSGIGIGVPGFVDNGKVYSMTNISKWKKTDLKKVLEKKYNKKIYIENDANCFAFGQAIFGKAKKYNRVLGITLGTGVGGGMVIDKKIDKGRGNSEIGHIMIDPSGYKCKCGMKGCLESWCSGKAIERVYKDISGKKINAIELDSDKSKAAKKTITKCADKLGLGMASLINVLNPDCMVIGGGASHIPSYVEQAKEKMKKYAFPENTKGLFVYKTKQTGVLGAAALVINQLKK